MLTARLLVPLGAPLQLSAGEILPLVQPNPLNTCSLAMVAPSLMSALVRVMLCACAALAPNMLRPKAAIQLAGFVMAISPFDRPGSDLVPLACHSNFRHSVEAGCEAAIAPTVARCRRFS